MSSQRHRVPVRAPAEQRYLRDIASGRAPAGDIKGLLVGIDEDDEYLRATREYNMKVLESMKSLDDAKYLLQRTHAVTVSVIRS